MNASIYVVEFPLISQIYLYTYASVYIGFLCRDTGASLTGNE